MREKMKYSYNGSLRSLVFSQVKDTDIFFLKIREMLRTVYAHKCFVYGIVQTAQSCWRYFKGVDKT